MSWRERMQTATYRGISFFTDSHETKGGRRVAVHEYPGGEIADSEDMGARAWDWKITAYFIGEDYDLARDDFITMLSTETEPDWLIHPWLGAAWVRATEWTLTESNDKGRYCQITIDFVDAREDPDIPVPDALDQAVSAKDGFGNITEELFDLLPMSREQLTEFIAGCQQKLEVLRNILSLSQLPLTAIAAVNGMIQGIFVDIDAIMATPGKYSAAIRSLYSTISTGASGLLSHERPQLIRTLARNIIGPAILHSVGAEASTDPVVIRNLAASDILHDRLAVEAAAEVALTDYTTADDRDAALSLIMTAIDTLLSAMPDEIFQAAVYMRETVSRALLLQDLRPLTSRTTVNPLPAAVLAYRLQVDEAAFVARNRVRHPLFVSGVVYG